MAINGDIRMKKERIRINLDISKELNEKLRKQADKQDMSMNALIRIALEKYLKEASDHDR
jgi:predicted HicB family RNase H-like nuclease